MLFATAHERDQIDLPKPRVGLATCLARESLACLAGGMTDVPLDRRWQKECVLCPATVADSRFLLATSLGSTY
jgi:hypothetical protein